MGVSCIGMEKLVKIIVTMDLYTTNLVTVIGIGLVTHVKLSVICWRLVAEMEIAT